MNNQIFEIINDMENILDSNQLKELQKVLIKRIEHDRQTIAPMTNNEYLNLFIAAKQVEGCSERTTRYYETTISHFLSSIDIPLRKVTTDTLRDYLAYYQSLNNCGKVTINNIRRNLSSFFSWLEEEDHILRNPIKRIHKIKTKVSVKETISDESIEKIRDNCSNLRDLAIIDLLFSTGMRVGELSNLNSKDINFEERECIVYGKGDKERRVYFDAKTKIHLYEYIMSRNDDNQALFVSLYKPHNRLAISGIEACIRKLGKKTNVGRIHPHKFRRSMATKAIDKGMPIEQVQQLLGHKDIGTTMQYAIVNQTNVKTSHRKYMA